MKVLTQGTISLTVKPEDVLKAYNGRVGCMCGCLGDYAYNANTEEYGHTVPDSEVNTRRVKCRVTRVLNQLREGDYDDFSINLNGETKYIYVQRDERCTCLYLK